MAKKVAHSLRESEKKTRQVFKPILDNPYTQSTVWPFVDPKVGEDTITLLEQILAPIGSYKQITRDKTVKAPEHPQIEAHATLGFNSTVKALESQASVHRQRIYGGKKNPNQSQRFVQYVFVARYDIAPAVLTNHFPVLAFTASLTAEKRVKLVQLPKGSMARLSKATGMNSLGIVGLDHDTEAAQSLFTMISGSVGDVEVPWLTGIFDNSASLPFYLPPVKFVATTAPVVSKKQTKNIKRQLSEEAETGSKKQKTGKK